MRLNLKDELPFTPLLIIGAPRSGTNALRDMLCALEGFGTWPCDEINAIWRRGNGAWVNDEIPAVRATSEVKAFVRQAFVRQWRSLGKPPVLVEKTCANSLRIPFVNKILPEAKYVSIVRNGFSVIPSSARRWRGEFEKNSFEYYYAKLRFVPFGDLLGIIGDQLRRRWKRFVGSPENSGWGPRCADISMTSCKTLEDVCARQWLRCTGLAEVGLAKFSAEKVARIRYEDLCGDPRVALGKLLADLNFRFLCGDRSSAEASIWRRTFCHRRPLLPGLSPEIVTAVKIRNWELGYKEAEIQYGSRAS